MRTNSNTPKTQTRLVLNSWKEIATFFDRGVRTVQRWEHELRLPVHRIGKGKRAPVYAVISELKFWMATSAIGSPRNQVSVNAYSPVSATRTAQLRVRLYQLLQELAESSVRHQRQTDALQKNLTALCSRVLRKRNG